MYPVPAFPGRTRSMTVAPEQAAEGSTQQPVHTRALIIGTGFSGLGMGIALQQQGVDFLILEKADEVGGTWRDNTYPGCRLRRAVAPVLVLVRAEAATGASCSRHSRRSSTTSRASPTSTGCAATSGSTRMSTARTGTTPSTAGTCSPTPGRSTSRSSSSPAPARCTFRRCPTSPASTTSAAPLSTPRSGTTTSTRPASGWR